MAEANVLYSDDPGLLTEVISAFPKRIESTLNLYKSKLLGSLPTSRDDFDPTTLLGKMEGGDKVIFMDSNKDLPKDWKTIDLKETFGVPNKNADDPAFNGVAAASSDDGGTTDDAATTDEENVVEEEDDDAYQDLGESTINLENIVNPPRVLVFTTVMLLGLLAICKFGSVDGTFKSMTKNWKQLFVFMVDYKGTFVPVAFRWLPIRLQCPTTSSCSLLCPSLWLKRIR